MKYCTQCGAKNKDDARYCTRCGHKLDDLLSNQNPDSNDGNQVTEQPAVAVSNTTSEFQQPAPQKNKKNHTTLLLVIIALFAIGGYWYHNRLPKGLNTPTEVLKYTYPEMKDVLFFYGSYHTDELNDNIIHVLKNKRTGRYVFKVKDNKTHKIHYCYIVTYGNSEYTARLATDIEKPSYSVMLNKTKYGSTAKVVGPSASTKVGGISIYDYNTTIGSLSPD